MATQGGEPSATSGEARRALTEANAALTARPARSADARRALDRAVGAGVDPQTMGEAYFRLGALDEEDGAFRRALTNYGACSALVPAGRWARNARNRIRWLSARSEGDFVPLAHLRHVQSDPALTTDSDAIDAFARDADTFPPGMIRGEARMLVAESWMKSSNRSSDAVWELRKVLDDGYASRGTAVLAERDLVGIWLSRSNLDAAATEVHRYPFDAKLTAEIQDLVRARGLRRRAMAASVILVALLVLAVARTRFRTVLSASGR
jgi:hypothetical protein